MSYETSDVKSVQKFLGEVKELADKINGVLPEDAEVSLILMIFLKNSIKPMMEL